MATRTSALEKAFENDLDRILRLYVEDETFAEICADYIELSRRLERDSALHRELRESLDSLEDEIRQRLAREPDITQPEPDRPR